MRPRPTKELVIGLMSGTSADGIDAVLAQVWHERRLPRARLVAHAHKGFSSNLRRRILKAGLEGTVAQICELNFELGEELAGAALELLHQTKVPTSKVVAIGSHGQTVHHLPNARVPSTLQIGEPCVIAERTGITTIADFRTRDMAAGGQGAPLVPFADYALFADDDRPRIVQNIGGIANLTFLPRRAKLADVIAFDTGPGNMVMDACAGAVSGGRKACDLNGKLAAAGRVSRPLLNALLKHPFLRRSPPRTTGREEFGAPFVDSVLKRAASLKLSPEDLLATVTAFTAESIAGAYKQHVFPKLTSQEISKLQVILGGGGALNPVLCRFLREAVGAGEWLTHQDFDVPNEAKEALAFALLAYQTLHRLPSNVPSATGARKAVVLGKIVPA